MDLWLSFLTGVLGSMHCVGMCGAVVVAYSTGSAKASANSLASVPTHLIYNFGRVLSYTIIGALVGLLGSLISAVQMIGVWFSLVAGSVMVVGGLLMLDFIPRLDVWSGREESWLRKLHLNSISNLISFQSLESKFYVGLLTPLLPCGLLYSMFIRAAASGSTVNGALTMLVFGAGIVPSLLLTGLVSSYVGIRLRYYANKLAAVTIILMGVVMILRGAGIAIPFVHTSHKMNDQQMLEHHH